MPEPQDAQLLDRIRSSDWLPGALVDFDFDLERAADGPVEPLHLENGEQLTMVAGDGSGGSFLLVGTEDPHPVLYASSEGSGGLIAVGLRNALALVVGLSSIQDAVSQPFGSDGVELRAYLARCDEEIRSDRPTLDDERRRVREALDLPTPDELVARLHRAAADERYWPISDAGDRYESLLA